MAPTISRTSAEPTLYEVLSLTPKHLKGQASAAQQKAIKHAYHKALLKHHPDKNPRDSPSPSTPPQSSPPKSQSNKSSGKSTSVPKSQLTYTIDQITHAYNVLSDARQRSEYDRQLLLTSSSATFSQHYSSSSSSTAEQRHSVSTRFHTGIETVDLDDLGFDERTGVYFGACRCGNERGFQFTETQLEEYEDDLVLMVQCLDCSLWLRVLFDAAEEPGAEPSSSPPSHQNASQAGHSHRHGSNAKADDGGGDAAIARQHQNRDAAAAERRGSHNGTKTGKGWKFNFSFNWGISLGGSAAANTSTGG
jgi:diphthamide biosynthesis protein 4